MTPFVRIVYFEFEPNCGGGAPVQGRAPVRRQKGSRAGAPVAVRSQIGGRSGGNELATLVRLRPDCQ